MGQLQAVKQFLFCFNVWKNVTSLFSSVAPEARQAKRSELCLTAHRIPFIVCHTWGSQTARVDVCLLFREGQLSGRLGWLSLPYMDLCSRSARVACTCKSVKSSGRCDVITQRKRR